MKNQPVSRNRTDVSVDDCDLLVPKTTVYSMLKRLGKKEVTYENVYGNSKKKALSADERKAIEDIIRNRDRNNMGLSRKECIRLVMDVGQFGSFKKAENHYDYLIRAKLLPNLKRNGRIVTSQATTTERCAITVSQQLRWHNLVDTVWQEMLLSNTPQENYIPLKKYFMLNLDEACFMCCHGILKIVGDGSRKRHDKNISDNRTSISVVRCGSAAGDNGPVAFVMKGVKESFLRCRTYTDENLEKRYGLPAGTTVVSNARSYMDDVTWLECVKSIAPGIRKMPVRFSCFCFFYSFLSF